MRRNPTQTWRKAGKNEKKVIERWQYERLSLTPFDIQVRRYLGLAVPSEPENSYEINAIINTFYLASRGRRYLSGMAVQPLPLSVADISTVIAAHPVVIDRMTLDYCIFALDDVFLAENE